MFGRLKSTWHFPATVGSADLLLSPRSATAQASKTAAAACHPGSSADLAKAPSYSGYSLANRTCHKGAAAEPIAIAAQAAPVSGDNGATSSSGASVIAEIAVVPGSSSRGAYGGRSPGCSPKGEGRGAAVLAGCGNRSHPEAEARKPSIPTANGDVKEGAERELAAVMLALAAEGTAGGGKVSSGGIAVQQQGKAGRFSWSGAPAAASTGAGSFSAFSAGSLTGFASSGSSSSGTPATATPAAATRRSCVGTSLGLDTVEEGI